MSIPRIGGPNVPLDLGTNAALWSRLANGGAGFGFNGVSLTAGAYLLLPPGVFQIILGPTTVLQIRDPVQNAFRAFGPAGLSCMITADGGNVRLLNQSGVVVNATVSAPGANYTSPPLITPSLGGATFLAVIGGAVAAAVGAGGSGYSFPPQLIFPAPPPGGVQATGHVTLTAGAIATVVMDNNGAGYATPPAPMLARDPRDTTGTGGVITTTLTGAGTVTDVIVTDPGVYGGGTLPTLAFAGGGGTGAAATAVQAAGTGTVDQSFFQPL